MTTETLNPAANKVYRFSNHAMLLTAGSGIFQVDFRDYHAFQNRAIFLECGQYIRLIEGDLTFQVIHFPEDLVLSAADSRFLFKHLVSLGYIELPPDGLPAAAFLTSNHLHNDRSALQFSIEQWRLQNPLQSAPMELQIMFDLKELIDRRFRAHSSVPQLLSGVKNRGVNIKSLFRKRLGLTAGQLMQNRILLEAQREIAFTDKSMKEITFDLGFNDPAYFNRFIKRSLGKTPSQFREAFTYDERDSFLRDLLSAIDAHYKTQRSSAFYADQLGMSIKTLAKKAKQKLQLTVGEVIRAKLTEESKHLLQEDVPIIDIAFELGFEEPNHFSAFFKTHTGKTPTQFRQSFQKVQ